MVFSPAATYRTGSATVVGLMPAETLVLSDGLVEFFSLHPISHKARTIDGNVFIENRKDNNYLRLARKIR